MIIIKPFYEILFISQTNNKLVEYCARVCYQSQDKIKDSSADTLVKALLSQSPPHESVIEHSMITVRFIINRAIANELVRHRLASYSQESTRYVKYDNDDMIFIKPAWVSIPVGEYSPQNLVALQGLYPDNDLLWAESLLLAELYYKRLLMVGCKAEDARDLLPSALKAEIVITANFREWRYILKLRTSKKAHPQMREIMIPLLKELKEKIPIIFEGIGS